MPKKERSKTTDIRYSAMNYLARREHSCLELINKLRKRFPDDIALLQPEVQKLMDDNLQSDKRFAESYVRHRSNNGFGLMRIKLELKERGVSSNDVEFAVAEEPIDWCALAKTVFVKKFGELPASDIKEKAKRVRYMQYRGFERDEYQRLI